MIEGQGMPGDKLLVRLATEREDQAGSGLLSTDPCRNSEPVVMGFEAYRSKAPIEASVRTQGRLASLLLDTFEETDLNL